MKLYLNGTSPFARLVRAAALELGVADLDLVWVDPWTDQAELLSVSPLSRVPVLVDDSSAAFTETLLILQRLIDSMPGNVDLCAHEARTRSELGIAYGVMELAFSYTIHKKHCADAGSILQARRQSALQRGLQSMEAAVSSNSDWSLARLCLWIALDYIRFRAVIDVPADRYPALHGFTATHQERETLLSTAFA